MGSWGNWSYYFDDCKMNEQNTLKPIKSANGLACCLIYCGDGQYRIRAYGEHKLGMFEDYDILISDLFFSINDEDAHVYVDEVTGRKFIDHNPETLGLK